MGDPHVCEWSNPNYTQLLRDNIQGFVDWGADFAIQLGDLSADQDRRKKFLTPEASLAQFEWTFNNVWTSDEIPLYNVMGNHEIGTANKTDILALWPLPENSSVAYYSFDWGDFHFVVLDSMDYECANQRYADWTLWHFYIWEAQKNWLIQDLQNSHKPTIGFVHVPLSGRFYPESPETGSEYNRIINCEEIWDILEADGDVIAWFEADYHNPGGGDFAYHWTTKQFDSNMFGTTHFFGVPCPVDLPTYGAMGFLTLDPITSQLTWDVIGENFTWHYEFGWGHEVAVTDVALSKTVVGQGYSVLINATVKNLGWFAENFNVTVYANATVIDTLVNVSLFSRNSATITFIWNTTGFTKGNYTITAYASPVPNETYTSDNTLIDGWVIVVGDVNGDGTFNILDLKLVKLAYSGVIECPNADLDGNGVMNILDLKIAKLAY